MADNDLDYGKGAAAITQRRGKTAAAMTRAGESPEKVKKYIARQGEEEERADVAHKKGRGEDLRKMDEETTRSENQYASYRKGGTTRKKGPARLHRGEKITKRRRKGRKTGRM
jgi:hypothetical protein